MRALLRYLVMLILASAVLTVALAWLASIRWQKDAMFRRTLGASITQGPQAWRREVFHLKPTDAVWIGFATNTLTIASVLLVISSVPFALRYHVRLSRRHCGSCGYPVGRQPFCTECGASTVGPTHVRSAARPISADDVERLAEHGQTPSKRESE